MPKSREELQMDYEKLTELEFAIDAAELATWNLNPATGKFTGNALLKSWFGLSFDADISLSLAIAIIHDNDRERVQSAIARALDYNSAEKYDIVYTILHPDTGQPRIVHAKGKAWFNEDHICDRFTGTLQDITSQVLAERKISESEAKYRDLFVSMDQGFCILEMIMDENNYPVDYRFLELNPVFETQTGLKNATGRTARELVPGLEKEWFEMYGKVAVTGESIRFTQGSEAMGRWFDVHAYRTGAPENLRVALLFTDITAKKLADIALEQSEQNLRDMLITIQQSEASLQLRVKERTEEIAEMNNVLLNTNEELAKSNRDLHQSNDKLAQYAYVASHDLQEPLRKIRTFGSILESTPELPARALDMVRKVIGSAGRMTNLIKDLLEFSTITETTTQMKLVNLHEVADAVIKDFELVISEKSARIVVENLPSIEAVPLQMNQLFYNLIGNALKFSSDDRRPEINLSARQLNAEEAAQLVSQPMNASSYFQISITDNGIGFEDQYAEHIFEVFKRLHGRHQYPGSGIGLSLCKKIVEIHGGNLYATAEPDAGAQFYIIIPATQPGTGN